MSHKQLKEAVVNNHTTSVSICHSTSQLDWSSILPNNMSQKVNFLPCLIYCMSWGSGKPCNA